MPIASKLIISFSKKLTIPLQHKLFKVIQFKNRPYSLFSCLTYSIVIDPFWLFFLFLVIRKKCQVHGGSNMADLENCPVTFFAMIAFKSATDSVSKNEFIKYINKYKLFHSKNKTNTVEILQNGHLGNRRKKPLWRGQWLCVACPPKKWPL